MVNLQRGSKINLFCFMVGLFVIMACGGSGGAGSGTLLHKNIIMHFNNNISTPATFTVNGAPFVVPANSSREAGMNVDFNSTTDKVTWHVSVVSGGTNLTNGDYVWTYATAKSSSKLDIDYTTLFGLSFSPEA
jgi:hypothetical protein